ncbi:hypothetical protein D3C80_1581570 [compost metagenome]
MNQRPQSEISFGYGIHVQNFAHIHRITEDAFGMAERLHILVHEQVKLLLDIPHILAKVQLLLQRGMHSVRVDGIFALAFGVVECLIGMVDELGLIMDVAAAGGNPGREGKAAEREDFNTFKAAVVELYTQLVNIGPGLLAVIAGHQQGEFFAAVPRSDRA